MELSKLIFNNNVKYMYQNINIDNKNRYGEVFTPTELVEEILNNLPRHV